MTATDTRPTSEEESRKVAEESREKEWAGRTFLRELFLGNFLLDHIHPFPAVSKENDDIERYSAKMKDWEACHNRAVIHLNESLPLTRLIPKDVVTLLTKEETERAETHLKEVGDRAAEDIKVAGNMVLADYNAWRTSTEGWVKEHNEIVKSAPPADVDAKR